MLGRVEKISSKNVETKFGTKTMYTVKIDGNFYSMWDNPGVSEGDTVEYEYTQAGRYKNLSSIKKSSNIIPPTENREDNRQIYIVRQSSLTRAIETLNAVGDAPKTLPEYVEKVFQLSEIYTEFVMEGITENIYNHSLFNTNTQVKKETKEVGGKK